MPFKLEIITIPSIYKCCLSKFYCHVSIIPWASGITKECKHDNTRTTRSSIFNDAIPIDLIQVATSCVIRL